MKRFFLLLLLPLSAYADDCVSPFGGMMADGTVIVAWNHSVPPYGLRCQSEVRICQNGYLSGSYLYPTCQEPAARSRPGQR